ncbi:outer membrane protein [Dyella tabacisoli]|uniref:Autotransporter subunit beta n=1 Tax=Dyella tabacisoli TaxID=2282381 RepID=A0A369UKF9_9GAMM|nr:outer membrane beta-barrel protein [Dyella tabacisoli]RDD80080.1 autotransporter subunit beta [Dyella tabacisoli]
MTKRILMAALAVALAAAATTSFAADTIDGSFFVNGNLGQSEYRASRHDWSDRSDTAAAVRFGYTWYNTVDFGVEGGYVDLGKLTNKYDALFYNVSQSVKVKGFLLGANGKYRFAGDWYVSAHGGWFGSKTDFQTRVNFPNAGASSYSTNDTGNGWYAGVGAGYDFTPNFSLGVNYDNYHAKSNVRIGNVSQDITGNVGMYSVFAEYRFR